MRTKKRAQHNPVKIILLLINLVAVLALIFSQLSSIISPTLFPLFGIFGLLYPPVLIINLFFVILWLLFRNKYAFISLVVILLGFGTLTDNFQFSFSGGEEGDTTNTKVLTYNLQRFGLDDKKDTEQNKQNILQFIGEIDPDIVCLQEYHGKGRTLYEPLMEMKNNLHAGAYYYESYFSPRFEQLTGLVIFSKYKAVNKGKLKFEGTRTFGIYTDLILNEDTVRVFNIHLASIQLMHSDIDFVTNPGQTAEGEFRIRAAKIYGKLAEAFDLRERQMDYLLAQIISCPHPIILSGDFNDTPSSFVYNKIIDSLEDTFVEEGKGLSITFAGQIPFLRIDYIMKSDQFTTLNYKRHKVDYSDHFPVSSILSLN